MASTARSSKRNPLAEDLTFAASTEDDESHYVRVETIRPSFMDGSQFS